MDLPVSAKKLSAEFIGTYCLLFLAALIAGPVSGASMNPARSLAPALIAWQTK